MKPGEFSTIILHLHRSINKILAKSQKGETVYRAVYLPELKDAFFNTKLEHIQ